MYKTNKIMSDTIQQVADQCENPESTENTKETN